MSREITVDYLGFEYNEDLINPNNTDRYNRYEFKFDFTQNQNLLEKLLGKEEDFRNPQRFSRFHNNEAASNNFNVPSTIFNITNPRTSLSFSTEENQLRAYRDSKTILSGGSTGFYLMTMAVWSSELTPQYVTRFDENDDPVQVLNSYSIQYTLERKEEFYSDKRPFRLASPQHVFSVYPNYEFTTEVVGEIEGNNHTVNLTTWHPEKKDGWVTTFVWRRFDSINDPRITGNDPEETNPIDIDAFIEERNPSGTLGSISTNEYVQLYKQQAIDEGNLSQSILLKQNKTLTIKNEPLNENNVFGNLELYRSNSSELTALTYAILGPPRKFFYEEWEDISDELYVSLVRENPWNIFTQFDKSSFSDNFSRIKSLNLPFKIIGGEYFETDVQNNLGVKFGKPTHITLPFTTGSTLLYYKLGSDLQNEFSRFTDSKLLVVKRYDYDGEYFSNLFQHLNRLNQSGETHILSSSFTHEISGNKIIVDGELDPYLLKLDENNYMYQDDIYVPYWQMNENVRPTVQTGNHPLGIIGNTNAGFFGDDTGNDRFYESHNLLGELVDSGQLTSSYFILGKRPNGDEFNHTIYPFNGPEQNILMSCHSIRFTASSDILTLMRFLIPHILTPYTTKSFLLDEFNVGRGKLKTLPLKTETESWINNSRINLLFTEAKNTIEQFENDPNKNPPGLAAAKSQIEALEEEFLEIMGRLSEPYIIRGEDHTFFTSNNQYGSTFQVVTSRSINSGGGNDIDNRTRMYLHPEDYSQMTMQDLDFINSLQYEIIITMQDAVLWEYNVDHDLGCTSYEIISEFDLSIILEIEECGPEQEESWFPWWIHPSIIQDNIPNNNYGQNTSTTQKGLIGTNTPQQIIRNPFFDYYFLENDGTEHYEFYFRANDMQDVNGVRHGPRKPCSEEAILKYPDLTQEQMDEMTAEEIEEYNDELPDKRNKYIAECEKIRAVISKQEEKLS